MKKIWMMVLAVSVVLVLSACSGAGLNVKHQGEGDSLITNKVEAALFDAPTLRTSQIHVRTTHGVVRLTGVVEKAPDVATATKLASGIPGVVEVENVLVAKQ